MMSEIDFYALDEQQQEMMLEVCLGNKGKCISMSSGMCGDIYIFDQGENVTPRYVCAKIPKPLNSCSQEEMVYRFVRELKNQLSFYNHIYVHWAFDFKEVMGAPVALFRYWGNDLDKLISINEASDVQKLSILAYTCVGLMHCYDNGLVAHQDLKPANIFLRNVRKEFIGLPNVDIYNIALIADFGLANASVDSRVFAGSRPYMAPEQWEESELSSSTDVFALGVILYELMTGGYHPVGIKLREFWPQPKNGNGKKWTRIEPWKKWATKKDKVFNSSSIPIDAEILSLIETMLSIEPGDRPSINEIKKSLLYFIRARSEESYVQIKYLIDYFNGQVSEESLEINWPYLSDKWQNFEAKFG